MYRRFIYTIVGLIAFFPLSAPIFRKTIVIFGAEVSVVGIILAIAVLLIVILNILRSLLTDKTKTVTTHMQDPWGLKKYVKVTIISRDHPNGQTAMNKYLDENGVTFKVEIFDKKSNLITGWKWENGKYYKWALDNYDDPAKGGYWEETDPPEKERGFWTKMSMIFRWLLKGKKYT